MTRRACRADTPPPSLLPTRGQGWANSGLAGWRLWSGSLGKNGNMATPIHLFWQILIHPTVQTKFWYP